MEADWSRNVEIANNDAEGPRGECFVDRKSWQEDFESLTMLNAAVGDA